MSEMNDIEIKAAGLEIQAAILHILDGRSHRIILSERTLDLENPRIEKYVRRYVNRSRNDMRLKPGTFLPDSAFEKQMERWFQRETDFVPFTAEALRPLIGYFEEEEARSFEVLAVDFRFDEVPYVLFILLEESETIAGLSMSEGGAVANTLSFANTALPAVSRSVASFALINVLSHEIGYVDEGKWDKDVELITERLLQAEGGISCKETVQTVREIACEVAEEFDENPALVLGRVKNYIASAAEEGMSLNTETMVSEVFEDEPEMARSFLKKTEEKTLPKETELPKASIRMSMRKQKIRTDTGIEITFPAAYSDSSEYIEFIRNDDGSYTIEIRSVNQIDSQI